MSIQHDHDPIFTPADRWAGGFYELAMELGERDDERLETAIQALCHYPALSGWYVHNDVEPYGQAAVAPSVALLKEHSPLYGIAALPDGQRAACGVFVVREESFEPDDTGPDWIGLFIPMGVLETVYDVGAFPFGDSPSADWRIPLDDWLVHIANMVFARVPFGLALIGHEVSGQTYHKDIQREGLPRERWFGHLLASGGRLDWFPPNDYEPPFQFMWR